MNQLEKLMKDLENQKRQPLVLKIKEALIAQNISDFLKEVNETQVDMLCLSSCGKIETLIETSRKIAQNSQKVLILELSFSQIFSYGIAAFVEKIKEIGISGIHVLDLPLEEQGQMVVHLLDQDGPNLLQEVTPASGDRIPTIVKYARGFIWCSDKGSLDYLSNLPDDVKDYYLFAVDAVSTIPVFIDFDCSSKEEAKNYLETAMGMIIGKELNEGLEQKGYTSGCVKEFLKKFVN